MAIDALINETVKDGKDLILKIKTRIDEAGRESITGQDELRILDFTWKPKVDQALWGGSDLIIIVPDREYRRKDYVELTER